MDPRPDERRHLTLLFCDVAEFTSLSERLDPEDLHRLLLEYRQICRQAIGTYQGHISEYLGDGVLSYFGYPVAHENNAVLAVRAALRILQDLSAFNHSKPFQEQIHVRVGLHAGLVVMGTVRADDRPEPLAVGESVNLAARIQTIAPVDSVLISGATARLIDGYFELEALGPQTLRGISRPIELFRVLRSTGARTQFEASARRRLTPHIGRDDELARLTKMWREVLEGTDRAVLVCGEAGIGKSRILHHVRQLVLSDGAAAFQCFCSPLTQGTPFAPIIEMLEVQLTELVGSGATSQARLAALRGLLAQYGRLATDAVPLIASLLSIPGAPEDEIQDLSPIRRRVRTMEVLREWMAHSAERVPLALIVEDLHWADPSSLELLDLIVRQPPGGRTLVCMSSRFKLDQPSSLAGTQLVELARLTANQVAEMVTQVAGGHPLPALMARRIAERTEGVPLFVEEVTKAVLESGVLRRSGSSYELTGPLEDRSLPATVQDWMLARFGNLDADVQHVAEQGAVIGREFGYSLIRSVCGIPEEALIQKLEALRRTELIFVHGAPPQAVYSFKHALIQDALYGRIVKDRKQVLHERIYTTLRQQFPEVVTARPEMAAYHAEKAGAKAEAISLLRDAGFAALGRTAVAEAVRHLAHGIEMVDVLPEPERTNIEIELQSAIGPAYMATMGWADRTVESSSRRLRELAATKGDGPMLFQAMWSLWTVDFLRGRLGAAQEVANDVLRMSHEAGDPFFETAGHHTVGYTHFYRAEYEQALRHAEAGLALFDLERERRLASIFQLSSSSAMHCFRTETLQIQGRQAEAAESLRQWRELLQVLSHPPSLAHALTMQCYFFHLQDDHQTVLRLATEARTLSLAEGFTLWCPIVDTFIAWAGVKMGRNAAEAVERITRSKQEFDRSLTHLTEVQLTAVFAETLLLANRPQEVLRIIKPVIETSRDGFQRHCLPELFRLQGEAARAMGDWDRAIAFYREAVKEARETEAKLLEARATSAIESLEENAS